MSTEPRAWQLWYPSAARSRALRMSAFENRVLLKSTAPQVLESSFLAAPKSSSSTRMPVPGWACAKSQPWAYAYDLRSLPELPYMYQAVTGCVAAATVADHARPAAKVSVHARSLMGISPRAPRPPHARAGHARGRPSPSPPGRAPSARRGGTARTHPRARVPRSAPAGPALLAPPPCLEGRRRPVTCLSQLARALLEACDRPSGAKERFVEVAHERRTVAVQENGNDETTQQLARRFPQLLGQVGPLPRGRAQQGGAAHRGRPHPVSFAEHSFERMAQLLPAERLRLEERQLPAVEGVAEADVVVGRAEPDAHVARHRGAERVESGRLARRRGRRDREDGSNPVRAPVEPLEEDRASRDRRRGGEADRGDCVCELGGGVGHFVRSAPERALQLEHADPIR